MSKTPIRVAVTGAAGAIGYSILFRIASGELFGPEQPVILHLVDIPEAVPALQGVIMELEDCAPPALQKIIATAQPIVCSTSWASRGARRSDMGGCPIPPRPLERSAQSSA